jgi:predicted lysophospholipase L1 biosynthesis ABC-type transport system permease subunit
VTQQTRDIGVRIALGAERSDVLRLVLGRGLALAGGGTVVGLVLAAAAARVARGVLYGVGPHDLVTLMAVAAMLLVTATLAASCRRVARYESNRSRRSGRTEVPRPPRSSSGRQESRRNNLPVIGARGPFVECAVTRRLDC